MIYQYVTDTVTRFKNEVNHVFKRFTVVFLKVLFVGYVAQVPFRNIAYHRHEQRDTLKDLGFELIPEISEDDKWISELIFMSLHFIGIAYMIVPWFTSYAHSNKIMGVVMAEQWLDCLCVGHFFRFITYTSTSLPGPASHCRSGAPEPELYRPTELITFFTRKASSEDPNCGDLIFSGHMFQDVILCIILTRYATKVLPQRWLHVTVPSIMWCLAVVQAPLIIAARNHYTVDIVVACYLAPLVWIALDKYVFHKKEESVDIEQTYAQTYAL